MTILALIFLSGISALRFQKPELKDSGTTELTREYCMGLPYCPGDCVNWCVPVPAPLPATPVAAAAAVAQQARRGRQGHIHHRRKSGGAHSRRRKSDGADGTTVSMILSLVSASLTATQMAADADFKEACLNGLAQALFDRLVTNGDMTVADLATVAAAKALVLNLNLAPTHLLGSSLLEGRSQRATRHDNHIKATFTWNLFTTLVTRTVFTTKVGEAAFATSMKTKIDTELVADGRGITCSSLSEESTAVSEITAVNVLRWTLTNVVAADLVSGAETAAIKLALKAGYETLLSTTDNAVTVSVGLHEDVTQNFVVESTMNIDFTVPNTLSGTELSATTEGVFRKQITDAIAAGLGVEDARVAITNIGKNTIDKTVESELTFGITLPSGTSIDSLSTDSTFTENMLDTMATVLGIDKSLITGTTLAITTVDGEINFVLGGLTKTQADALLGNAAFKAAVVAAINAQLAADGITGATLEQPEITHNNPGLLNLKQGQQVGSDTTFKVLTKVTAAQSEVGETDGLTLAERQEELAKYKTEMEASTTPGELKTKIATQVAALPSSERGTGVKGDVVMPTLSAPRHEVKLKWEAKATPSLSAKIKEDVETGVLATNVNSEFEKIVENPVKNFIAPLSSGAVQNVQVQDVDVDTDAVTSKDSLKTDCFTADIFMTGSSAGADSVKATKELCKAACVASSTCKSWTFTTKADHANNCQLKTIEIEGYCTSSTSDCARAEGSTSGYTAGKNNQDTLVSGPGECVLALKQMVTVGKVSIKTSKLVEVKDSVKVKNSAAYQVKFEVRTPSDAEKIHVKSTLQNAAKARAAADVTKAQLIAETLILAQATAISGAQPTVVCTGTLVQAFSTEIKPATAETLTTQVTVTIDEASPSKSEEHETKLTSLDGVFVGSLKTALNANAGFTALSTGGVSIVLASAENNPFDYNTVVKSSR